jgi:hypothetical protein
MAQDYCSKYGQSARRDSISSSATGKQWATYKCEGPAVVGARQAAAITRVLLCREVVRLRSGGMQRNPHRAFHRAGSPPACAMPGS